MEFYIGSGKIDKNGKCKLNFQSLQYLGFLSQIKSNPNLNNNMTGFIFKATNIVNFYK